MVQDACRRSPIQPVVHPVVEIDDFHRAPSNRRIVRQKVKRLLTLLEPALILGLGAVIALVIVSVLMAMLGLNELVV